jgi:integrase/recombinase XerD
LHSPEQSVLQIGNHQVLTILKQYEKVFAARISDKGCFFMSRVGARISDQSVRFMIKRLCEIAGVTAHITPHMFRHTFATLLLEEDVDIRYIQNMLGHSSIRTTQIYTHIAAKKQRTILEAKHPRNNICGNLEKKVEFSDAV